MIAKTPDYITIKETAETWGVTRRYVNMCIANGRVPCAVRTGNMWLLPKDTVKPAGSRRERKLKSLPSELAYVIEATTKPLPSGNSDAVLDSIAEGWLRLYCEGTFAYLWGDYAKVLQCFRKIGDDEAAKLRYCPLAIAAAINTGDYPLYLEIETYCKNMIEADMGANVTAVAEYALATAYVGAYAPEMVPGWLKGGGLTALPFPLRPEAICKQTRYLHFVRKYESVLDVARTALAFDEPDHGISYAGFYLRIMCAAACCSLDRMDDAEKYLLGAMSICLPHGFVTPFAEVGPLFCGLLERLLKREYPAYYDAVTGLSERIIKNWLAFHNRFTKDNITLILSPREYQVARLAAQGVPYKRIAEQYHITVGSLNNTMQRICEKLFVPGKKELVNFIL